MLPCLAAKVHDIQKVFEGLSAQNSVLLVPKSEHMVDKGSWPPPIYFVLRGDKVQLIPFLWQSFDSYAADMHLKKSGLVVLAMSTGVHSGSQVVVQPTQPWPPPMSFEFMGSTNLRPFDPGKKRHNKITMTTVWVVDLRFAASELDELSFP